MAQRGRPRKTFAQNTTADPFASLEKDFQNAQTAQAGGVVNEEDHRCSIKIPGYLYKYLKAAMYRDSSPEKLMTMNEYFIRLLQEDMERHQDN